MAAIKCLLWIVVGVAMGGVVGSVLGEQTRGMWVGGALGLGVFVWNATHR